MVFVAFTLVVETMLSPVEDGVPLVVEARLESAEVCDVTVEDIADVEETGIEVDEGTVG
jgi:hypothetical protein